MYERPEIHMTQEEFVELRDLICARTGIHIRDTRMEYLEYRVVDRMQATHTRTVRDYYYVLRYNRDADGEMQALINAITVQETHFNRNPAQIKTFRDVMMPAVAERRRKAGDRSFNIWSAACATGEEPYTLAICTQESAHHLNGLEVTIHASDISTRALNLAEKASYSQNKLRDYDEATIARYFDQTGDRYVLRERIRSIPKFGRINLVEPGEWRSLPKMDIIFCRNVFIYFDQNAKNKVAQQMYDQLRPGGCVFLGNAETIDVSVVPFKMKFMEGGMVYEKL